MESRSTSGATNADFRSANGCARARHLRGGALRASESDRASRPEAEQHPRLPPTERRSCSISASPSFSTHAIRPDARRHAHRVSGADARTREPGADSRRRHHDRERHLRAGRVCRRVAVRTTPVPARRAASREIERIICEQEAPTPSAMVARTAGESPELLDDIAACRSTTGARLQRDLRGDIDNIIGMAMRKDAERRHGSAEQLGADIDRHLTGQPVLPHSDTWLYRSAQVRRTSCARGRGGGGGDRDADGVRGRHVRAVEAHRVRARHRHDRTHARRAGLIVPRRIVRAVRSVPQPRQPGDGARAARHRRAARQYSGSADQPEREPRCSAPSGACTTASGCIRISVIPAGRGARPHRSAFTARSMPRSRARSPRWADALCQRGDLQACAERLDAALDDAARPARADRVELAPLLLDTRNSRSRAVELDSPRSTTTRLWICIDARHGAHVQCSVHHQRARWLAFVSRRT